MPPPKRQCEEEWGGLPIPLASIVIVSSLNLLFSLASKLTPGELSRQ